MKLFRSIWISFK